MMAKALIAVAAVFCSLPLPTGAFESPQVVSAGQDQHEIASDQTNEAESPVRRHFKALVGMGKINLSWSQDGQLRQGWVQSFETKLTGLWEFYRCDETVAELELSGDQKQKYQRAIADWEQAISECRHATVRPPTESIEAVNQRLKACLNRLDEQESDSLRQINDLLLEPQSVYLEQLQFRQLIRAFGLSSALFESETLAWIGLTERDLANGLNMPRESRTELERRIQDLLEKATTELLSQFDKPQKDLILKKWPLLSGSEPRYCEFLRVHLLMVEQLKSLSEFSTDFERIDYFPMIQMSPAGLYEIVETSKPEVDVREHSVISFVFHKVTKARLVQELSLTEEQWEILWETYKSSRQSISGLDPEAMLQASHRNYQILRSTLSDEQWLKLEALAKSALEQRMGPVNDLLHGSLGEHLKLTADQKTHLRKAAENALKLYEQGTIEIEEWWVESILERLEKEPAARLRDLLGPQPKNTPANLHAWLPFAG